MRQALHQGPAVVKEPSDGAIRFLLAFVRHREVFADSMYYVKQISNCGFLMYYKHPASFSTHATGKAEYLFWPGQKRAGAVTGPEGMA